VQVKPLNQVKASTATFASTPKAHTKATQYQYHKEKFQMSKPKPMHTKPEMSHIKVSFL